MAICSSQTITSGGQNWAQSYTSDGLNRIGCVNETPSATAITCNTGSPNWLRTSEYDPCANGWVASNSSTLPLNSFTPIGAVNFDSTNHLQITGENTSYDGAGNQKTIGGYSFSYDAENRMTSSTVNGGTTQYSYDGLGDRVTKTMGGATTTYVYDAANQLIAEYGNPTTPDSGTKYISVDHLGSTRLVTDSGGNPEICYDYLPFGEQIASGTDGRTSCYASTGTPLTQKFTGKQRDTETGLDFFEARYFSSRRGGLHRAVPWTNVDFDVQVPQFAGINSARNPGG